MKTKICVFAILVIGLVMASPVLARPQTTFTYGPGMVYMYWESFPNTGFSLALNNYEFSRADSLVDTYNNFYTFRNVSPGKHYVHMKYGKGDFWSEPEHWEINVPDVLGTATRRYCFWFFCW